MDEGSGDGSHAQKPVFPYSHVSPTGEELTVTASPPKNNGNLESLQSSFKNLILDESNNENWDIGNQADDDGTSSEESDVVPICSYPYGYIKRQTIYTCLTCNDPTKEDWKPAGICIGCRYACHQGHEVISMETRRNFKCDCGNKKFPETSPCVLCPTKDDINVLNVYNDNYKGTFCSCHCKEAECAAEDPLYQCVVCEDWYHATHCNAKSKGIEKNYTDLICGDCTSKLDFLRYYEPFDPTAAVDDKAINEMMKYSELDELDDNEPKGAGNEDSKSDAKCKLESLKIKDPYPTGQLWTLGWRGKLCRCVKCKEMYAKLQVSFLLDLEDETRRYFSEDEEEDTQDKICTLVRKFEEWLFQMDPKERIDMFQLEPDEVKQKMRDYFIKTKKECDDVVFDDHLLDQLFDSFAEFILDSDGGADYLYDVDALEKLFGKGKLLNAGENDGNSDASASEELSSNMV